MIAIPPRDTPANAYDCSSNDDKETAPRAALLVSTSIHGNGNVVATTTTTTRSRRRTSRNYHQQDVESLGCGERDTIIYRGPSLSQFLLLRSVAGPRSSFHFHDPILTERERERKDRDGKTSSPQRFVVFQRRFKQESNHSCRPILLSKDRNNTGCYMFALFPPASRSFTTEKGSIIVWRSSSYCGLDLS